MSYGRARGNILRGRGQRFRGQRRGNSQAGGGMSKEAFSFDLNDALSNSLWKTNTVVLKNRKDGKVSVKCLYDKGFTWFIF